MTFFNSQYYSKQKYLVNINMYFLEDLLNRVFKNRTNLVMLVLEDFLIKMSSNKKLYIPLFIFENLDYKSMDYK